MKDGIQHLRQHLFETIEMLKSGEMEIDKAKAIAEVGGKIIETAKVEVDYLRATDQSTGSEFLQGPIDRASRAPRLVSSQ